MSNLFTPSFLLKNRHVQTLYSSLFRKIPNHTFDVEKFELSDGDFIECYWYNKRDKTSNKPIVLLFHGLTGSYKSPYILGTMRELDRNGASERLEKFALEVAEKKRDPYSAVEELLKSE